MSSGSLTVVVIRGSTIRVQATIKNYDEGVLDPASHVIKLLQPDGTQEGSDYTSPSKNSPGVYHQDLEIPETGEPGEWGVEWKVTADTKSSIERVRFKVVE